MKRETKIILLALGIVAIIFVLGQPHNKENVALEVTDTIRPSLPKTKAEHEERRQKRIAEDKLDSLRLANALNGAIEIAMQSIGNVGFEQDYEVVEAEGFTIDVGISWDHHFTKLYPHLLIRRSCPVGNYIDIYKITAEKFEKVLSHEYLGFIYLGDSIYDVNGDGAKDFVVNWYPDSGCCLRSVQEVFLLRKDKQSFSNAFEFMNPTFSPKEKVIRGVSYGHPGETQMYKFRWRGEAVDTIAYIYYEADVNGKKTGKIISSQDLRGTNARRLNAVPNEYKTIEGYDWFTY